MEDDILKILLIEDNPGDARLINEMLKESEIGFNLIYADRLSAGINAIRSDNFDVILLDLGLPDSVGIDTLKRLNDCNIVKPIIVLTGLSDDALGMEAVKEGAEDYLIKGEVDKQQISRAIRYAIERKRAKRLLKDSEESYRTLVEAADDIILLTDMNGKHLLKNNSYLTSLGYEAALDKETDGKYNIHTELWPMIKERLIELLEKGKISFTYSAKDKDGNRRYLFARSTLIADNSNKPKSILSIIRDISLQKQTEEELWRYRHSLENIVRERTKELEDKIAEIQHINKLFVGRELAMIELKNKIAVLEKRG